MTCSAPPATGQSSGGEASATCATECTSRSRGRTTQLEHPPPPAHRRSRRRTAFESQRIAEHSGASGQRRALLATTCIDFGARHMSECVRGPFPRSQPMGMDEDEHVAPYVVKIRWRIQMFPAFLLPRLGLLLKHAEKDSHPWTPPPSQSNRCGQCSAANRLCSRVESSTRARETTRCLRGSENFKKKRFLAISVPVLLRYPSMRLRSSTTA